MRPGSRVEALHWNAAGEVEPLVVLAAAPFASRRGLPVLVVGGSLGIGLWSVPYSYRVWHHDPLKVPPAGTSPADGEAGHGGRQDP